MPDRPIAIIVIIIKIISQVYRLGPLHPVYAQIKKMLSTTKADNDK